MSYRPKHRGRPHPLESMHFERLMSTGEVRSFFHYIPRHAKRWLR